MPKDTATAITPVSEKNIAAYGLPPLTWDRALKRIQEEWKLQGPPETGGVAGAATHWLGTKRPDGRPMWCRSERRGMMRTFTSPQVTAPARRRTWRRTRIAWSLWPRRTSTLRSRARRQKVTDEAKL